MSRFLVVMAAPAVQNSDKLQYYIGRSYTNVLLFRLFIFIISPLPFIAYCRKST